ncbi:MAG: hypothetical protein AAF720_15915, partial [Pseudomonadota bacterium]
KKASPQPRERRASDRRSGQSFKALYPRQTAKPVTAEPPQQIAEPSGRVMLEACHWHDRSRGGSDSIPRGIKAQTPNKSVGWVKTQVMI